MPLSQAQSKHLCRRVGFGGKPAEVNLFETMERAEAVEYVLDAAPSPPPEPPGIDTLDWWTVLDDVQHWWIQRMADARWHNRSSTTPSPLEEKMTLFWHSHFASGVQKVEHLRTMWDQHEILRNRGMGSFQELIHRVCTNGAILRYLDNDQNTRQDLQENFARELMELYTIGPDEFVESDVIEMTKAWSGHGIVGWNGTYTDATYRYRSGDHDDSRKVLFGLPAQRWNGPDTLPIFTSGVKRDACARFLATKLWRFFVNDHPTAAEVQDVANGLLPNLNITSGLRVLLNHDSFWSSANRFALTRSPIEFVVDVLRRLNIRPEDTGLWYQFDQLGQIPFEPPSVAGWGTGDFWVSTMTSWGRAGWLAGLRWNDDVHGQFQHLENEPDAAAAADEIISIMGIPSASAETRRALERFWQRHQNRDGWAIRHNAVIIGGMMPELHVA